MKESKQILVYYFDVAFELNLLEIFSEKGVGGWMCVETDRLQISALLMLFSGDKTSAFMWIKTEDSSLGRRKLGWVLSARRQWDVAWYQREVTDGRIPAIKTSNQRTIQAIKPPANIPTTEQTDYRKNKETNQPTNHPA
jgi:hypothetical protein